VGDGRLLDLKEAAEARRLLLVSFHHRSVSWSSPPDYYSPSFAPHFYPIIT